MTKESITDTFIDMRMGLRMMASRILRSQSEVDDALQDAFVRMWQSADDGAAPLSNRGTLVTILRNVCIDRIRRRRNLPHEELGSSVADCSADPGTADRVENRDMIDKLAQLASQQLTGITRSAFELYAFHELDYQEVASRLGITPELARTYVSRARKRIRELIKNGAI